MSNKVTSNITVNGITNIDDLITLRDSTNLFFRPNTSGLYATLHTDENDKTLEVTYNLFNCSLDYVFDIKDENGNLIVNLLPQQGISATWTGTEWNYYQLSSESVYEIGVLNGFKGSKYKFLKSLIEVSNTIGDDGLSAYEIAKQKGFTGTEEQWLHSLIGNTGAQGIQGIQGPKGDTGDTGAKGEEGDSAYNLALKQGFVGDVVDWLNSLKGAKGDTGDTGAKGDQGIPGRDATYVAVQKIILPIGSTFFRGETTQRIYTNLIPLKMDSNTQYILDSPYEHRICNGKLFFKDSSNNWILASTIYNDALIVIGATVNIPGDGKIYINTGSYLYSRILGSVSPATNDTNISHAEWALIVDAPTELNYIDLETATGDTGGTGDTGAQGEQGFTGDTGGTGASGVLTDENVYTRNETIIGTWIDGRPLYRNVFTINTPNAKNIQTNIINNLSNISLIDIRGIVQELNSEIPIFFNDWQSSKYIRVYYHKNDACIYCSVSDNSYCGLNMILVIEYIKTTDTVFSGLDFDPLTTFEMQLL